MLTYNYAGVELLKIVSLEGSLTMVDAERECLYAGWLKAVAQIRGC